MVEINSKAKLEAWLEDQPQDVSIAIAARAAWRVLPRLAVGSHKDPPLADFLLPLLRGSASALVAPRYPTSADGKSAAAVPISPAGYSANLAYRAILAASFASASSFGLASAASAAVDAVAPGFFGPSSASSSLRAAAYKDAVAIANHGLSPRRLMTAPLWPDGVPDFAQRWSVGFRNRLAALGDGFSIWADYYDAVLAGGPRPQDAAFARAIDDLALWEMKPADINARLRALVEEETARGQPAEPHAALAIEGVPSAVDFEFTSEGKIAATAGALVLPHFINAGGEADHADQLELVRHRLSSCISDLVARKYNVRPEYLDFLQEMRKFLPSGPADGNLKWSDSAFRLLTAAFNSDVDGLPDGFAAKLHVLGQEFQALRAYYSGLLDHYDRIRSGRVKRTLPSEMRAKFMTVVKDATPHLLEPSVSEALGHADVAVLAAQAPEPSSPARNVIAPLPDPIANVDPEKDRDVTFAGVANALVRTVEAGEKLDKGIEGWSGFLENIRPYWGRILEFLQSNSGGGPPTMPPTLGV